MFRALLGALASVAVLAAGAAAGDLGYRFISLDGNHVKWGAPVMGAPASVHYAFVATPVSHAGAYNCGEMVPLDNLLAKSGIARTAFEREVERAFQLWQAKAGISFEFVADPAKADILIGAQAVPYGFAYANVSYSKAGEAGLKTIDKSLICLNPERRWKIGYDGNLFVYDIGHTLGHEIGHAIGLDHPGATGQLMGFRYDERHVGLQAGDLHGARALYGLPEAPLPPAATMAASAKTVTRSPLPSQPRP